MKRNLGAWLPLLLGLALLGEAFAAGSPVLSGKDLSAKINNAASGESIVIPAGHYQMEKAITIFKQGTQLIGAGSGKTILDFSATKEGGQAILIRGPSISVAGLTILNAPGDGIVARGVRDVTIKDISVRWQDPSTAGGYGIYPVQCIGVLVQGSEVTGANEAGIYVGQTQRATVTENTVYGNVVGIDIENSSSVAVSNNHTYQNSIGIAVTGRPYLIVKNPAYIQVVDNVIEQNDRENFGPDDAFTTELGQGVGIMVVAVRELTIKNNRFIGGERLAADITLANFNWLERVYKTDGTFNRKFERVKIGNNHVFDGKLPPNTERVARSDVLPEKRPLRVELKGMGKEDVTPERLCFTESVPVILRADIKTPNISLLSCEAR